MKFVIGDIHGCYTKLVSLMNYLETYNIELLVFIGDYIDKGPDVKSTLEYLNYLSYKYQTVFIEGNHEYVWRRYIETGCNLEYIKKYGGLETLRSIGVESFFDLKSLKYKLFKKYKFISSLLPYYEYDKYIIVHSGLKEHNLKNGSLKQIKDDDFLFNRYDFLKNRFKTSKYIVFGHTGFVYPYFDGQKVGIDTSAVYYKNAPITAFELKNSFFVNSNGYICNLNDLSIDSCPMIPRINNYDYRFPCWA